MKDLVLMFFVVGLFLTIFLFCFPSPKYTYTPPGIQKETPEIGEPLKTFTIDNEAYNSEDEDIVHDSSV